MLPESGGSSRRGGGVVVAVRRPAVREIHEREEIIVPGVVVAILLVPADVVEQLVIQGLAVAAAADEVARERALEEATRRDLAAEGELHLRGLGRHRAVADAKKAEKPLRSRALTEAACRGTPLYTRTFATWIIAAHGSLQRRREKTKHNTDEFSLAPNASRGF